MAPTSHDDPGGDERGDERRRRGRRLEALGALSAGIAHDLNNVLTTITGYAELLQEDVAPGSDSRESVDEILVAARRARTLVGQVLGFARSTDAERRPISLAALAKEVLRLARMSLPPGVTLRPRIDDRARSVSADPLAMYELLSRLLVGIGEATAAVGGGAVDVHVRAADPSPAVVLEVRAPAASDDLAAARAIVADHGGALTVERLGGEGVAVVVRLPDAAPTAADGDEGAAAATDGGRVLVVDDEPNLVRLVDRMLTGAGFAVEGETSGQRAIERLRAAPQAVDLVVADVSMPGVSGVDLLAAIRDLRPGLPVILCTGRSDVPAIERARGLGVAALLRKPFRQRAIVAAARRALEWTPAERP